MEFKDKVVIVTGSGRGIGQAIALKFAKQQAKVIVADRDEARAKETAKLVEEAGGRSLSLKTDVTDFRSVQEMLKKTVEAFGTVDILVNNAGWDVVQPFFENSLELWDKLIDINLKSCLYCCRVVGEFMMKEKKGKILNISSDAGRIGAGPEPVYAAAKGGVIAFTKSLAPILAPYNININSVSPGLTATPAVQKGMAMSKMIADEMEKRAEKCPFKRAGKPEEVADAVVFLCSEAAGFITGQILSVNGGATTID
jgi:2-hydroxycyclohexanecarboxyl-CoA dehydrogenase